MLLTVSGNGNRSWIYYWKELQEVFGLVVSDDRFNIVPVHNVIIGRQPMQLWRSLCTAIVDIFFFLSNDFATYKTVYWIPFLRILCLKSYKLYVKLNCILPQPNLYIWNWILWKTKIELFKNQKYKNLIVRLHINPFRTNSSIAI